MKKKHPIQIAALAILLLITAAFIRKQTEPWRPDQLMAPKDLAAIINSSTEVKPLIISVGPAGFIKDAVDIGPAQEKENLKKLKKLLSEEKKDREIVIYCGCCPFQKCPNIRPAFSFVVLLPLINFQEEKQIAHCNICWKEYFSSCFTVTVQFYYRLP